MFSCNKDTMDNSLDVVDLDTTGITNFHITIDGKPYYPIDTCGYEWIIKVPQKTNLNNLIASFNSGSPYVYVNGTKQVSGYTANDFSNIKEGVVYSLSSDLGGKKVLCQGLRYRSSYFAY